MKKFHKISLVLTIFTLSLVLSSCNKDDDFHSISNVERAIYNKINGYRASQGLNTLVEQFLYFEESRKISDKLANGTYNYDSPEIQTDIEKFYNLLGGTTFGYIVSNSNIGNADSIVNAVLNDASFVDLIKREFTQYGVGVSQSPDGIYHICQVFVNIPD